MAAAPNEVVGSLMITYEWSDWNNAMHWWIQSVYVDADVASHGRLSQRCTSTYWAWSRDAAMFAAYASMWSARIRWRSETYKSARDEPLAL